MCIYPGTKAVKTVLHQVESFSIIVFYITPGHNNIGVTTCGYTQEPRL